MTLIDPDASGLIAAAKSLTNWHATHGFCAVCGTRTEMAQAGWQRNCPSCNASHFPRTDPVVIMLVTHGNEVLLARNYGWPERMYSVLAGFVEPGETFENAVRREVLEETAIEVDEVQYLACQPWPYPSSLMIGAHARATSYQITRDEVEIEDALWLSREELLQIRAGRNPEIAPARAGSIANAMLENWLADAL